jgi:hypothetical protein
VDIWFPSLHIQFYVGYAGSVLTAVMLLFHQQIHLLGAPGWILVSVNIVLEWLFEADQCDAAFVFD